jgi:hypothetical protein
MSIAFVRCTWMLLLTTPNAVLLSVLMEVLGCLWPILSRSWHIGTALWALIHSAPSSALAALDMTAFRILETLCTAWLFHGFLESLEHKQCPPTRLRAEALLR